MKKQLLLTAVSAAIALTSPLASAADDELNFDAYREMLAAVAVPLFASGGITTVDNVRHLAELGVAGCVIGRALYEGQLDLASVIGAVASIPPLPKEVP